MKKTMLSIIGIVMMSLLGCASHKLPVFERPIYALDNHDPTNIVLRYRKDKSIIQVGDVVANGAVVFLPDDFYEFCRLYVVGNQWPESINLSGAK